MPDAPKYTAQEIYDILCIEADKAGDEADAAAQWLEQAQQDADKAEHTRQLLVTARDSWRTTHPDVKGDVERHIEDARQALLLRPLQSPAPDLPPNTWVETADRFLQLQRPGTGLFYLEWNKDNQEDPEHPELEATNLEGWWLHSTEAGLHQPLFCGAGDQAEAIETATKTIREWEIETNQGDEF